MAFLHGMRCLSWDGYLPHDKPTQKTASCLLNCTLSLSHLPLACKSSDKRFCQLWPGLAWTCPSVSFRQRISQPLIRTFPSALLSKLWDNAKGISYRWQGREWVVLIYCIILLWTYLRTYYVMFSWVFLGGMSFQQFSHDSWSFFKVHCVFALHVWPNVTGLQVCGRAVKPESRAV